MDRKSFGLLVGTLRKQQRNEFDSPLNQNDLAEIAQIPLMTLQKIEQGRSVNLSPDSTLKLAKALGLPTRARQIFFLASTGIADVAMTSQNNL